MSALSDAAKEGNLAGLQAALKAGAKPEAKKLLQAIQQLA